MVHGVYQFFLFVYPSFHSIVAKTPTQTATKGDAKRSLLFDTGPEEEARERNVNRLNADISKIETIHLSLIGIEITRLLYPHLLFRLRNLYLSGGVLKAISMIFSSRKENPSSLIPPIPDYRSASQPSYLPRLQNKRYDYFHGS